MQSKRTLPPRAVIIGPQLLYALDHAYLALILIRGLKINRGLEINHLCEFLPSLSVVFLLVHAVYF